MDTLYDLSDHIKAYWMYYAGGGAIIFPLVYMTRKYSLPVIQWILETIIYSAIMHVVVHYFVFLCKMFKMSTSMYWEKKTDPGWMTPLFQFWDKESYTPVWVFYIEIAFVVIVLAGMFRYRPIRPQRIVKRTPAPRGGSTRYDTDYFIGKKTPDSPSQSPLRQGPQLPKKVKK